MKPFVRSILVGALLALPWQWSRQAAPPARPLAASGTFVVNSTADTPDADTGDGVCADAGGHCSLRAAIMQADFATDPNTITVPSGVYLLTRSGDDDGAVLGDLDITGDTNIQGSGAASTIIDANGGVTHDRVVQILSSAQDVSISNLTLRGGVVTATFAAGGGLLWNAGSPASLRLSHMVVEDNRAYDAGGISLGLGFDGNSADLEDVTIRRNTATAAVGGLAASLSAGFETFALRDSQVYSNTAYEGGGLYFDGEINQPGSVSLQQDEIYSNTAFLSAGLENHAGYSSNPLQILNTRLHDNHSSYDGGGIGNYGQLVISDTTLAANTAVHFGGGLYDYDGGQVSLNQSTFSANSAQTGGGLYAEYFIHGASVLTVTNSTVSDNTASQDGAGFYLKGGRARFYNATIAGNRIQVPDGTTYAGVGGGLYISTTVPVSAQNTLIALNTHRYQSLPAQPDDCFGPLDLAGYNVIQNAANCPFSGDTSTLYIGYPPLLGPLTYNGGPTETRALALGNVAIDTAQATMPGCTGPGNAPLTTDQRGFARPHGPHCDIGAFEYYTPGPFLPLVRK